MPLFPLTPSDKKEHTSLFPLNQQSASQQKTPQQRLNVDWLSNSSFQPKLSSASPTITQPALETKKEKDLFCQKDKPSHEEKRVKETKDKNEKDKKEKKEKDKKDKKEKDKKEKKEKDKKEKKEKHKKEKKEKDKKDKKKKEKTLKREKKSDPPKKTEEQKILEFERRVRTSEQRGRTIPTEEPTEPYVCDRKGDYDNLVFESLHTRDIPKYYLSSGFAVGLAPREVLEVKDKSYVVVDCREKESLQSKLFYQMGKAHNFKLKKFNTLKKSKIEDEEFIPLEDPQEAFNQDVFEESLEDSLRRQMAELHSLVQEDPMDAEKWKKYINFQDSFLKIGRVGSEFMSQRALSEKKISIYEKALEYLPENQDLLLGYFSEASKILDSPKLAELWERIANQFRSNWRLSLEFIEFLKKNFNLFTVSSIRRIFSKTFYNLQLCMVDFVNIQNLEKIFEIERGLLEIFSTLIFFEAQAGFSERALGLLQAQVEFNLFSPRALNDYRSQLSGFEKFWNSQQPRIGETGAKGWFQWAQENQISQLLKKPQSKALTTHKNDNEESVSKKNALNQMSTALPETHLPFSLWAQSELQLENQNWSPLRVHGKIEIKDPDSVTLFQDVEDYLFHINSEEVKLELAFRMVEFLGFNLEPRTSTNGLYYQSRLRQLSQTQELKELFASAQLAWGSSSKMSDPKRVAFVQNVFEQLDLVFEDDEDFCRAFIAFVRLHSSIDHARNILKKMMQRHKTALRLYCEYAMSEFEAKNDCEGRKVLQSTLALAHKLGKSDRDDVFFLFRAWAQKELQLGNKAEASHILCCAPFEKYAAQDSGESGKLAAIKARKMYEQKFEQLEFPLSDAELAFTECYSLFELVTVGFDSALSVYNRAVAGHLGVSVEVLEKDLVSCGTSSATQKSYQTSTSHQEQQNTGNEGAQAPLASLVWQLEEEAQRIAEQLVSQRVALISQHRRKCALPPAVLRNSLIQAMRLFPANSTFLHFFVTSESQSQISGRIRSHFDQATRTTDQPVIWLFWLMCEMQRAGAQDRVRNLFERAFENGGSRTANSPAMWRLYLEFIVSFGPTEALTGLFFRAIHAVPSSKMLWMSAFELETVCRQMSAEELGKVARMLNEKELRIRDPDRLDEVMFAEASALPPPLPSHCQLSPPRDAPSVLFNLRFHGEDE